MEHYLIGKILEDGTKVKGVGDGGYEYFLDTKAFYEKNGVCYIDKNNCEYEYEDFVSLTKGNHNLAENYFLAVCGTSPELLLEEDLNEGEVYECPKCEKLYFSCDTEICSCCN